MPRNSTATSEQDRELHSDSRDADRRVLDRQLVLSRNQIQVLTDKIESLNEVAAKK